MKGLTSTIFFLLMACNFLSAQKAPYRVVLDMTSHDTVDHKIALRWVEEILTSDPNAMVEIVLYGKSLDMINKNKSVVAASITKYSKNKNVQINVCRVAMKNNKVDDSMLVEGVGTVPDGIYEIISKQHEGWGYIKVSH